MSAMPATQVKGHLNFALGLPKMQYNPRKLDSISQAFQSDREDAYHRSRIFPGYPLMEIEEVETLIEIPGQAYEHRLRAKGFLKPESKCESTEKKQPAEGWDEVPETWLTHDPDSFIIGSAHPDHPNVYLEAKENVEKVTDKISRIQCAYKGIILDASGNIKAAKWKGTVNGESISTNGVVNLSNPTLFVDENGTFDGYAAAVKARFDTSRIVLIETRLSLTPPPTNRVGRQKTPGHIPVSVFSIWDDPYWVSSAFTYNYPGKAWKLASVQFDQVLDKPCFLYTLSYEYQPEKVPTL
jgi:hypothetical protein